MIRLLLILLVWGSFAHAEDPLPSELPLVQEESALRMAERTGSLIFRHDRAAAVATDALAKAHGFKRDERLQGWVSEELGQDIVVTFLGSKKGDPAEALYRVKVDSDGRLVGKAVVLATPEPLSDFEAGAAKARSIATALEFQPCAEKYNSVVLPSEGGISTWVVYLLPSTTEKHVVPIGGAYRVEVDNGSGEAKIRPFTRTCIQLQNEPKALGLIVTHLLDPVPTEVHVFWSIWAKKPIVVSTPPHGTVWLVDGASIKLVERRAR